MAAPVFKVVQLDDGSITVDAPASAFPDSGYFTLYDKAASAKGACLRTLCAGLLPLVFLGFVKSWRSTRWPARSRSTHAQSARRAAWAMPRREAMAWLEPVSGRDCIPWHTTLGLPYCALSVVWPPQGATFCDSEVSAL